MSFRGMKILFPILLYIILFASVASAANTTSNSQVQDLQAKIVNLTKENRELKAELANLTNKYNTLKARADFLEQQNEEYRTMLQNLLGETAKGSEEDYIEQAKKERLIGSVIIKTLVAALVVVGLIGYGLHRKKRGWEYPL